MHFSHAQFTLKGNEEPIECSQLHCLTHSYLPEATTYSSAIHPFLMSCSDKGSENNPTHFHRDEARSTITHCFFPAKQSVLMLQCFMHKTVSLLAKANSPSPTLGLYKDAATLPTLVTIFQNHPAASLPDENLQKLSSLSHHCCMQPNFQAKLPFESKHLLLKDSPTCFLSSEKEIPVPCEC